MDLNSRQRFKVIDHCATSLQLLSEVQELLWRNDLDSAMLTVRNIIEEQLERV